MQTRKKIMPRNMSREQTNSRSSRLQKKVTAFPEKKVTELITSSAKKQKSVGIHVKQTKHAELRRNCHVGSDLSNGENHELSFRNQTARCDKVQPIDKADESAAETIFSPAFHHVNDSIGGMPSKEISRNEEQMNHYDSDGGQPGAAITSCLGGEEQRYIQSRTTDTLTFSCDSNRVATDVSSEIPCIKNNHCNLEVVGSNSANSSAADEYVLGNLSSEVSAIYLSIQNSKLECIDEQSQDTMSTEGCAEQDECDDFDDFDPYLFIKDLPDLSAVVPRFRPMLLPKQTRSCPSITLVLDLDETLVHSTLEPCEDADFTFPVNFNLKEHTIYVRCRPYLKDFLEKVSSMFETIIFTASQSIYAEQLLNVLDPRRKLFRHRVYRDSCVFVEGNYLKDLSVLGRDLSQVIIIDNSPQAFGFQIDNGIPIESWFDNRNDQELLLLLPFLESLRGVGDVRPLIAQKFNLREKVAAAACLSIDYRT